VLLAPPLFYRSSVILGFFLSHQIAHVGVKVSRDLKLFGHEIILEEVQRFSVRLSIESRWFDSRLGRYQVN